jgi:ribosomal protein L35
MPARKMKVDVFDTGGNRYSITFEGQVTRDKALRLLEIVELLGGVPGGNPTESKSVSDMLKQDKVRFLVERNFPIVWFSSKEVQTVYERELKEPISLSTVSTYLSRLAERGFLSKTNSANKKRYRLTTQFTQSAMNVAKDNKQTDSSI